MRKQLSGLIRYTQIGISPGHVGEAVTGGKITASRCLAMRYTYRSRALQLATSKVLQRGKGFRMAWHGMVLNLCPMTLNHIKYSAPDCGILRPFILEYGI